MLSVQNKRNVDSLDNQGLDLVRETHKLAKILRDGIFARVCLNPEPIPMKVMPVQQCWPKQGSQPDRNLHGASLSKLRLGGHVLLWLESTER